MINSSSDRLPLKLSGMPCNQFCLFITITFHSDLTEGKIANGQIKSDQSLNHSS